MARRFAGSCISIVVSLLVAPGLASAQDADTAEVQRYALTEAALAKYTEATRNLSELEAVCDDALSESEEDSQSIDDMVAALERSPGAREAVQAAGLTPREYVVFSLSLLQNALASFAASQSNGQLPAGVSKANVDFVTEHEAELAQLEELESASCEDELDGDAEE